jgi:hypothetical protein
MQITSKSFIEITTYNTDANGKEVRGLTTIRPGKHDYQTINHKDPRVAEQLRIFRKHGRISFDELLASDIVPTVPVSVPAVPPTPTQEVSNVSGLGTDESGASGSEPSDGADQSGGPVSGKGRNKSR